MKISIQQLLFNNYIKYDKLTELTNIAYNNSGCEHLNIIIDMHSLIKQLYPIWEHLMIENQSEIASSIINLCAHLRQFYWSRYRVTTEFYIVYSNNSVSRKSCQYFNYDNRNRQNGFIDANNLINDNIKILDLICKYLPDIYFINEDNEDSAVVIYTIANMIQNNKLNSTTMVFTRDTYLFGLVGLNNNITVFTPSKSKTIGDVSYFINSINLYDVYRKECGATLTNKIQIQLNPSLFYYVLSMAGSHSRSITKMTSTNKAIDILKKGILDSIIPNTNMSLSYLDQSNMNQLLENNNLDYEKFKNNLFALSVDYNSLCYINNYGTTKILESIINLYDAVNLKNINNTFFKNNPLDLNVL